MKKHLLIFLVLVISISEVSQLFAQEKQKDLMESYIGKWRGDVTSRNYLEAWGFDEYWACHQMTEEMYLFHYDLKIVHPFDDSVVIDQFKNFGYTSEYIQVMKNLMDPPDELNITGYVTVKGFVQQTHETQKYCEECSGKDGTTVKNFPEVVISVSGRIDLVKNKISIEWNDEPKGYSGIIGFGEPKLVALDKIVFKFEYFEEPPPAGDGIEQEVSGELYRIKTKKDTLGKTVHLNEPIITDKFTLRDIIVPNKGRIIVNPNSECKFSKDNLLELTWGELITIVKKLKGEGEDFRVESPQAVIAVRGTQFITKVKKDGTTTLTVIDGEVEFLDKQMRKMVLVKKNQKSVVKPGGLPSEPVSFDPKMIPKWWE